MAQVDRNSPHCAELMSAAAAAAPLWPLPTRYSVAAPSTLHNCIFQQKIAQFTSLQHGMHAAAPCCPAASPPAAHSAPLPHSSSSPSLVSLVLPSLSVSPQVKLSCSPG